MMTTQLLGRMRQSLIKHEGYENKPYVDSVGKITIGCGYNLSDRGIENDWINKQLDADIAFFFKNLCSYPWFKQLNTDRQIILVDMAFMGWKKFLEFHKMFFALESHDYEEAAEEMINSEWAKEVKGRAIELADGMRKGVYNV